jgi:predicted nucleotidyltransferase
MAHVCNKGVFADESEALSEIVRRLVLRLDPESIWLFGSRARGTARPDSDFDLLLVAKPDSAFGSADYDLAYQPVIGLGVGCDIVPCSAEDFEEAARIKTSLIAQVLNEGRRLYDAKAH